MLTLIVVSCCSLLVSFLLTPFFRDFFGFLVIVDKPDARKIHARPIPRVGGIPLAVSYALASLALLILHWRWKDLISMNDPTIQLIIRLLPAAGMIFITGLIDDLAGLSPGKKLLGELAAGSYACWIGVRLATPAGYHGPAILIDVISIVWLIFCANAINLIDGMDGLATGVALLASISLLMAAVIHHHPELALAILPFIGGLFGFLCYNFNPASVFLGDSGSLLVGFLLGSYGLMWNRHASTGLGMAAPLVALAFPVTEVLISVMRRFLRHKPIFGADRGHIHHKMLSLGLSQRRAVLSLYGISALAGMLAVLQTLLQPRLATVLLLLFLTVAYLGFRSLRYAEFGVLRQFLFAGEFRRALRHNILLHEYEDQLSKAKSLDQCWVVLRDACRDAEFTSVSLRIGGRVFTDEHHGLLSQPSRSLQMWLSSSDSVTFGMNPRRSSLAMLVAPFVEALEARLRIIAPAPPIPEPVQARGAAAAR